MADAMSEHKEVGYCEVLAAAKQPSLPCTLPCFLPDQIQMGDVHCLLWNLGMKPCASTLVDL